MLTTSASSGSRAHGRGGVMSMSQPGIFFWRKDGTLAQMAQATVALLGFLVILFQINEIRSNNRAVSARQAFLALLRFGVSESEILCARLRCDQGRKPRASRFNMREFLSGISLMPARRRARPLATSWSGVCLLVDYDRKPICCSVRKVTPRSCLIPEPEDLEPKPSNGRRRP